MKHGQGFILTRGAMAIAQREGRNSSIMISKGSIIEVLGGPFNGSRLMEVRYDGEKILMFTNDMQHHTEAVEEELA